MSAEGGDNLFISFLNALPFEEKLPPPLGPTQQQRLSQKLLGKGAFPECAERGASEYQPILKCSGTAQFYLLLTTD